MADPTDLDMGSLYYPEGVKSPGQHDIVQIVAEKISGEAAPAANEMVMPGKVRIKPCSAPVDAHGDHQAEIIEQPQRSVHRIQRYRRQTLLDTLENLVSVGVIIRLGNLPEDLCPLMGQLDALLTQDIFKVLHPLVYFMLHSFHNLFLHRN